MICVCISSKDFSQCLSLSKSFPFVEVRIDLCCLNIEQIQELAFSAKLWIATCRKGKYSDSQRLELLSASIDAGANYIDIEYDSDIDYANTLISKAKNAKCKVIISWHDYHKTPSLDLITNIIEDSQSMGADLVKIVPTAIDKEDGNSILSLYNNHNNIIAFCMGEIGRETRYKSVFLGAPFTYASPSNDSQIALGQYSYQELFQKLSNH